MKKVLLALLTIILGGSAAAAQSVVNNPDNSAYWGIRVAGDIVIPGKVNVDPLSFDMFKPGGGIELGGIYNLPVVANFYLEPGLKFYYNTYSVKDDLSNSIISGDLSLRKFGMRIPVMAGYHFDFDSDFKLHVFTGPEFEVGLWGREYATSGNIEISDNAYGDDGINRFDFLWGVGAGLTYRHVFFGIIGSFGLCNMSGISEATYHENRVSISLGYNF